METKDRLLRKDYPTITPSPQGGYLILERSKDQFAMWDVKEKTTIPCKAFDFIQEQKESIKIQEKSIQIQKFSLQKQM